MDEPARSEPLPVSVVIPTIGRSDLLRACLASIVACEPPPAEVVVVDQSDGEEVAALCAELADRGVRRVVSEGRGIALGTNTGLREAAHDLVLQTNDDCTVAPDWVAVAWRRMQERPDGIVTGRVLAAGDPAATPSTREALEPRDYTGEIVCWALYAANMAVDRRLALDLGGFDERPGFRIAASDNDFGFRWLRAGRPLLYEPAMVIWHHDWRSPDELARRWREYARGQGVLYGKHLHARDPYALRWAIRDLLMGVNAEARGLVRRRPRWKDERRALLWHLPRGIVRGYREARRLARA